MNTDRLIPFAILILLFSINTLAQQREVKLHRHQIFMIIGAEGGLNSNVGDVGARVDYYPAPQFGIGAGIGTAFGVPRWTAGAKIYIGDPTAGFNFFFAYSGNAKRDGVEVSDVEFLDINNSPVKQTVKLNIDPVSTLNAGIGLQFMIADPINLGVFAGYMFPIKKREESYTDPRWNNQPVNVTTNGINTIVSEIPGGIMIGATLGFTLFSN